MPETDRLLVIALAAGAIVPTVFASALQRELEERGRPPAAVEGRFLLPDGAPAAGAQARLYGWPGDPRLVMEHGVPETWDEVTGTTDADGRLELSFAPPLAFQFVLEVTLPGHAAAQWRWFSIEHGQVVDVGVVPLLRGGAIEGHILDAEGHRLTEPWSVRAETPLPASDDGRDATRVRAESDPETGAFRLVDVPPGRVQICAYSRIAGWIDPTTVEVTGGQTARVDLRYDGPDLRSCIVVAPFTNPFSAFVFGPPAEAVEIVDADGIRRTAVELTGSTSFRFADLAPGEYTVAIADPRYVPWRRAGVVPGSRVDAHLTGSAAVRLELTDERGAPVPRYGLAVRYVGTRAGTTLYPLQDSRRAPPASGLHAGLLPGDLVLRVDADGCAPTEFRVDGLEPGESRVVRAVLGSGVALAGVVHAHDGATPATEVAVTLRPVRSEPSGGGLAFPPLGRDGQGVRSATTDERGRFRFERLAPGRYLVEARPNALVHAAATVEVASAPPEMLVIDLPPTGALSGRIVAPEGASLADLTVCLAARGASRDHAFAEGVTVGLASNGTFQLDWLPITGVTLHLSGPMTRISNGFGGSSGVLGSSLELGDVTLAAGARQELELDLREEWPGTLDVRVLEDGAPVGGSSVSVLCVDRRRQGSAAMTDADGRARFPFLAPGEWRITVQPAAGGWTLYVPSAVHVESGAMHERRIDIPLVRARLRVRQGGSGAPLASRPLRLEPAAGRDLPVTTDAEGWLDLALPTGTYTMRDVATGNAVSFRWAPDVPAPPEVYLSLR